MGEDPREEGDTRQPIEVVAECQQSKERQLSKKTHLIMWAQGSMEMRSAPSRLGARAATRAVASGGCGGNEKHESTLWEQD